MAITNYSELKTAAGNWQHRTTTSFTARVAEFISLFEASANATISIRENEIEVPLVAVVGSSFINLPSDFSSPIFLKETTQWRDLAYNPPNVLPYYPTSAWSERWTIKDTRIQTERNADQAYAYTFRYSKSFALSDAVPTNTLLTRYPNVYLYGSLLEAAPYVRDLALIGLWQSRYDRAKGELDRAETEYKKLAKLSVDPALMTRPAPFNINRGY